MSEMKQSLRFQILFKQYIQFGHSWICCESHTLPLYY